jgi:hypothetical protein
MQQSRWLSIVIAVSVVLFGHSKAHASCTVPNQLTNGQTADASQVMANFNSVLGCVNGAPAGSANALQYNAGSGAFGAVGPLTNGQIAIGSTGTAPQAAQLAAGPGIAITNGPGSITISSSASPYMPPKLANFTWGNQPTGTIAADSSTGLVMYQPSQNGQENLGMLWDNTPIPATRPFTVTFGLNLTTITSVEGNATEAAAGLAIGDGTGKFVSFEFHSAGLQADCEWTNYSTVYGGCGHFGVYPMMNVIRVNYDGTNFSVSVGPDTNSLIPVGSYAANSFIGTPTQVGVYVRGLTTNGGATFFHYSRSDGAP